MSLHVVERDELDIRPTPETLQHHQLDRDAFPAKVGDEAEDHDDLDEKDREKEEQHLQKPSPGRELADRQDQLSVSSFESSLHGVTGQRAEDIAPIRNGHSSSLDTFRMLIFNFSTFLCAMSSTFLIPVSSHRSRHCCISKFV